MFEAIFTDNFAFQRHSTEHYVALLLTFVFGGLLLHYGRNKWSEEQRLRYIFYFSLFILFFQAFKTVTQVSLGVFNPEKDIPLHLCNFMPYLMPIIFYKRSRQAWAILFFWIVAGTFQAIFTPTQDHAFPHYDSWRYWFAHSGLVVMALYGAIALRWTITWKDALYSAIAMNLLALVVYPINLYFNSNYMYLLAKPPGKTMYDLLADWPHYILCLEGVIVILFGILLIPFWVAKYYRS